MLSPDGGKIPLRVHPAIRERFPMRLGGFIIIGVALTLDLGASTAQVIREIPPRARAVPHASSEPRGRISDMSVGAGPNVTAGGAPYHVGTRT